jgi:hypothetical protein
MKGNQIRGLVLDHLVVRFHKDESTVRTEFIFIFFTDRPTFIFVVSNLTVVSTYCLEFDLNFTFHRATNSKLVLIYSFKDDFLLD